MSLLVSKTPVECMLGNFEKSDIKRIYEPAVNYISSTAIFRNKHFAYAMEPFLKKKLSSIGIELYPNGYIVHSHPFSKTLENHLLFDVLPGIIHDQAFIFCSIKECKIRTFKAKSTSANISFLNRLIDGRDVARYPEVTHSSESQYLKGNSDSSPFSNSFKRTVGQGKNFFFHDEVHHWSQKDIFRFLKDFSPKRLVFTVVYPAELLAGYANSQNPKMYKFKIDGDKLFFFPDGVTSEGYQQPLNLNWLFKASHLVDGDKVWTVVRHCSKFSHHLFEILPGELHTDSTFFFNDFDVVNMSIMFKNRFRYYDLFPVNYQHLFKVYSYLNCLKNADVQSGLAKLRQILGEDIEVKEFLFFEKFCTRVIEKGTSYGLFGHSLFEKLSCNFIKCLPNSVARLFPSWRKMNTFDFLYNLDTLNIEVKRGKVFRDVLEKCPIEIIRLNCEVFLDPLPFFSENENFNDERVDDVVLETVILRGWNHQKRFNPENSCYRESAFDILSRTINSKDGISQGTSGSLKGGVVPTIKRICWVSGGPFLTGLDSILGYEVQLSNKRKNFLFDFVCHILREEKIHIDHQDSKFLENMNVCLSIEKLGIIEAVIKMGERAAIINRSMIDFGAKLLIKERNDLRLMSKSNYDFLIESGGLSKTCFDCFFEAQLEADPFLEEYADCFSSNPCSHFFNCDIDVDGNLKEVTFCRDGEFVQLIWENSLKTRGTVPDFPTLNRTPSNDVCTSSSSDVSSCFGENVDDDCQNVDYSKMFCRVECDSLLGDIIDVPADGDCFLWSYKKAMNIESTCDEIRSAFSEWLAHSKNLGVLADSVSVSNTFFEHEHVYFFAEFAQVTICVHSVEATFLFGDSGCKIHLNCDGTHFSPIILYNEKKKTFDQSEIDGCFKVMNDGRLSQFNFDSSDSLNFKWRGRESAFFSKVDADYGHNGMIYPHNGWVDDFDKIVQICDPSGNYNSVLVQWYKKGAGIGLHRDNESVYGDDPILTVNLSGKCTFSVEVEGNLKSFELSDFDYFVMPHNFQKRARHSVHAIDARVSLTFRLHKRKLSGKAIIGAPSKADIEERLSKKENMCLIDSISESLKVESFKVVQALMNKDRPFWEKFMTDDAGGDLMDCEKAASDLLLNLEVHCQDRINVFKFGQTIVKITLTNGHFSKLEEIKELPRSLVSQFKGKTRIDVVEGLVESLESESHYNLFNFEANMSFAGPLMNSFLNRSTGICLGSVINNGGKYFEDVFSLDESSYRICSAIHALNGFAGSGKSKVMQNWLSKRRCGNYCVVCPRVNLAHDWKLKLGLTEKMAGKVPTFETFVKMEKKNLDLIVLDELTLFPNGYLDWLVLHLEANSIMAKIVVIFDPLQSRYHNEQDCHVLNFDHEVDRMISGQRMNYLYTSYRLCNGFFKDVFEKLQLPIKQGDEERRFLYHNPFRIQEDSSETIKVDVLIVESQLEKKTFGSAIKCMTFGESQGLTFDHVCILLSESSANSCEFRWMVALTRAKKRLSFCCTHLGGIEDFTTNCKSQLFKSFFSRQTIKVDFLRSLCQAKMNMVKKEIGGKIDEVDREERLSGDPFLKPFIFLGKRVEDREIVIDECDPEEVKCKTHLYLSEPNFAGAYNFDLIREKESREYRESMMSTDQFCDNYNKKHPKACMRTVGPMRFKSIYPKHSSDDDMTFWMAVKKRLRFQSEEENRMKLSEAHLIGGILYQNFKEKFDLDFSHDQGLFERCVNEFEEKKLGKSQAVIKSHSNRSDTDWKINDIFLFMKNQLCTKFEKQYVDAKAGQTLACFQHLILVFFAPWCRYMEHQIRSQLPEEIYIHSNKNFDDLNEWTKKFFARDICVESDYEAFDASQDEYILSFEMHLMEDMGIPRKVIDAYVDLKCTLGCKLGHFAIMRFTGEFCTFLFNTTANMAFTMCRYEWRRGQPIAFAGDDMCALNNLPLNHDFDDLFDKLSLKAKVERTDCPMFCGWRLTQYGIIKEPELVYNRFQVAIEEGKVAECLENYAIEVSYAYKLSERLFEVLKSEKQLQYHQAVVRFIVKNIRKLKTNVKLLFEDQVI
ncbi:replicase polyprotein [Salvia divinorum RNA virus 1]|uniref:replicase polyprotein n=1 Tax=Salvia divinorum RNA virus 1 TaxID=2419804 RepID=UPI000EB6FA92|nr:replicase polyprotein [Salvia divinorum RNA virus 1]AYE54584.1 replicase polyprotein [Salvia divinorum RNA virus 1]